MPSRDWMFHEFQSFRPRRYWVYDEKEPTSAKRFRLDTVMVDLSAGTRKLAIATAPSLHRMALATLNPGFYEQEAPLSALPRFAAVDWAGGSGGSELARGKTIRRMRRMIPRESSSPPGRKSQPLWRAKSLLFFMHCRIGMDGKCFERRSTTCCMLAGAQVRTQRPDCRIRTGNARECRGVRAFVDEAPGVPEEFRALQRNCRSGRPNLKRRPHHERR